MPGGGRPRRLPPPPRRRGHVRHVRLRDQPRNLRPLQGTLPCPVSGVGPRAGPLQSVAKYQLPKLLLFESGKVVALDGLLPGMKAEGKKILLFSQFVIVLDILEDYLRARNLSFLRLDGTTPVVERLAFPFPTFPCPASDAAFLWQAVAHRRLQQRA